MPTFASERATAHRDLSALRMVDIPGLAFTIGGEFAEKHYGLSEEDIAIATITFYVDEAPDSGGLFSDDGRDVPTRCADWLLDARPDNFIQDQTMIYDMRTGTGTGIEVERILSGGQGSEQYPRLMPLTEWNQGASLLPIIGAVDQLLASLRKCSSRSAAARRWGLLCVRVMRGYAANEQGLRPGESLELNQAQHDIATDALRYFRMFVGDPGDLQDFLSF
ncbi:hypothetical protein BJX99DRAFT_254761 [Aspergillus californicus]